MSPAIFWAILGFILLIVEMLTLTFVLLFFGLAALVVAALKGFAGLDNLALELVVFGSLGGACLLFFRGKLQRALQSHRGGVAIDQAQSITLSAAIPAGATVKVEYQGVPWDATNESDTPLRQGDKAVIVRTEGIRLIVRPTAAR